MSGIYSSSFPTFNLSPLFGGALLGLSTNLRFYCNLTMPLEQDVVDTLLYFLLEKKSEDSA